MTALLFSALVLATAIPPPRSTGEAELESGVRIAWTYHFNRNSGAATELAGDRLVVLTVSGDLLSVSIPDLAVVTERVGDPAFTSLARSTDGGVIVGRRDGSVFRIDPRTLDADALGHVDGEPLWANVDASGSLVAVIRIEGSEYDDFFGRMVPVYSERFVSPDGAWSLPGNPSTYLLDRAGRVWIGADLGEFGGWTARVDPGRSPRVEDRGYTVAGFLERPDGAIWAYVGGMHFDGCWAAIVRMDRERAEPLWAPDGWPCSDDPLKEPVRPGLPLSWMANAPDGSLIVLAYDQLFHVDADLQSWTLLRSGLPLRYFDGRAFAVGSPPTLVGPHLLSVDPAVLAAASRGDGFVLWSAEGATVKPVPGAIEARRELEPVPGRPDSVLLESDWPSDGRLWSHRDGAWSPEEGDAYAALRSFWCGSSGRCSGTDFDSLFELQGGEAVPVADLPEHRDFALLEPRVVDPDTDPVVLAEPWTGTLWRVDRRPSGVSVTTIGKFRKPVVDAAPHPSGDVLVATEGRWYLVDPLTGRKRRADVPRPPDRIDTLARDGRGRLWAFGDGAWLRVGGTWRSLDAIPVLRRPRARTARPVTGDPDAVVVTLEGRGAVVVRVTSPTMHGISF